MLQCESGRQDSRPTFSVGGEHFIAKTKKRLLGYSLQKLQVVVPQCSFQDEGSYKNYPGCLRKKDIECSKFVNPSVTNEVSKKFVN